MINRVNVLIMVNGFCDGYSQTEMCCVDVKMAESKANDLCMLLCGNMVWFADPHSKSHSGPLIITRKVFFI